MSRGRGRLAAALAAGVAALTLAAPAYAHFCFKTGWSPAAAAAAAGSNAWLTGAEWTAFIEEAVEAEEICQDGADVLLAAIAENGPNTLYMGPGLLAGGTLKNGKGTTPAHVGYMPFEEAFAACGGEGEAH
jgi:hypothetical protein